MTVINLLRPEQFCRQQFQMHVRGQNYLYIGLHFTEVYSLCNLQYICIGWGKVLADLTHHKPLPEPIPDSKVHGANMGPTWVLSAPDGPHEPCYQGCWSRFMNPCGSTSHCDLTERKTPATEYQVSCHHKITDSYIHASWLDFLTRPLWAMFVVMSIST